MFGPGPASKIVGILLDTDAVDRPRLATDMSYLQNMAQQVFEMHSR